MCRHVWYAHPTVDQCGIHPTRTILSETRNGIHNGLPGLAIVCRSCSKWAVTNVFVYSMRPFIVQSLLLCVVDYSKPGITQFHYNPIHASNSHSICSQWMFLLHALRLCASYRDLLERKFNNAITHMQKASNDMRCRRERENGYGT